MASVFYLYNDAFNIKQKIVRKYSDFSETDKKLYFSAVTIQRQWRGYVVRKMIEKWNEAATTLQRFIRGWLVRLHLPDRLKAYYYKLSVAYYNEQATKIQAYWKGYHVRKNTISIKAIRAERAQLEQVSREMQEQIRKQFEALHAATLNETQQYIEKILMILFERHHLLRTRTQEGIFSIHGSYDLSCIEKILKSFKLTEYIKEFRALFQQGNLSNTEFHGESKEFNLYSPLKPKPYERMLSSQETDDY